MLVNKTGNVRTALTLRCVHKATAAAKNNDYTFICVCVCVCVCEHAHNRAWKHACVDARRLGVYTYVRACSLSSPAYISHAPYCIVTCDFSGSTIFFDIISQTACY